MIHDPHSLFRPTRGLWQESQDPGDTELDKLVKRSRLLGSDRRVTNTGGGNTSAKIDELDPVSGETRSILWVKGSGGDLRTSGRASFASLDLLRLRRLRELYLAQEDKGSKSPAEDRMVAQYPLCVYAANPKAASIDTPLHGFVDAAHVDHMHPNALIALAATERSEALTKEIFGEELGWLPWMRPGFELGLAIQRYQKEHPKAVGVLMAQHGVISWADDAETCYERSLDLCEKAAEYIESHDRGRKTFGGQKYQSLSDERRREVLIDVLPWLRGAVSSENRFIATVETGPTVLRFVDSFDAPRLAALGTSCPDHFLRTKIQPLYVDWDPQKEDLAVLREKLEQGLVAYRKSYAEYYEACKRPDSPPMRDASPTVILIPGVGMITFGKNKSESRVTAEFYGCAIAVMHGAEAMDRYIALPRQEAFDIEYWALEEAKLRRQPKEREFARSVVLVVGAGHGIGKATALRFAKEGAHVVCADLDLGAANACRDEILELRGQGVGVAGTGISSCGPAIAAEVDITKRKSIQAMLDEIVLAYGGLDHICLTAGVYIPEPEDRDRADAAWTKTFAVNVAGAQRLIEEARIVFDAQRLPGSVVLTTSVNGVVPKAGSLAYDTSKAATNHLVRELALMLAPHVRVNGVAPATVVAGSTMFPRDRVLDSLRKYGIEHEESEDTDALRDRLATFYAKRTLTGSAIYPEDQAEMIYFLSSPRASKSTGQIVAVDGGLAEAFLR